MVRGGGRVRAVLEPVYAALELDWDPATAGDLADVVGGVTMDVALDALRRALAARIDLAEAPLDAGTLALANSSRRTTPRCRTPTAPRPSRRRPELMGGLGADRADLQSRSETASTTSTSSSSARRRGPRRRR